MRRIVAPLAPLAPLALSLFLGVAVTAHALGEYVDQYPDDVFAFACAVPSVDITNDGATPIECALMLTACVDAMTGQCVAVDPKACHESLVACWEHVEATCWPMVD